MMVSEDNMQRQIMWDGKQLKQVSEFKYLGYILDDEECGKKVADAIKYLRNAKGIILGCTRVLHEDMLLPVNI